MTGGGKAPAQPSTTTTVQEIPSWMRKPTEDVLAKAKTISEQPYQAYKGPQIAGLTPDQKASFEMVRNMEGTYLPTQQDALSSLTSGAGTAGGIYNAGAGNINASTGYNPLDAVSPYLGSAMQYNTSAAGQPWLQSAAGFQADAANAGTPGGISSYMSPYTNDVVRGIQDQANQNWTQNIMPSINDKFIGSGQYASGRNAQVLGQAAGNFQTGLSANVANALEAGYGQASQNAGNQAQLLGNLGSQAISGAGQAGNLENQQFGNLINAADTAGTATQQQSSNLRETGTALGNLMTTQSGQELNAGNSLASLSQQQQDQALTQAQALQAVGQQQQQMNQANLDVAKQNWTDQVNYPKEQTQYLSQIIRGLPAPNVTTGSTLNSPANSISPLLGLGTSTALLGSTLSNIGKAKGGLVKGYAEGGMVDEGEDYRPGDELTSALDTINQSQQNLPEVPKSATMNSIEALSAAPASQVAREETGVMTPAQIQQDKLLALARGLLTPTPGGDPFAALGQGLGNMQDYDMNNRKLALQQQNLEANRAIQNERLAAQNANYKDLSSYREKMLGLKEKALNPVSPINSELTGDDYLATIEKQRADKAKAVAEGRIPLTAYMLRSPYGQQLLADAMQYDPTFDASKAPARAATRKDFASGKSAQNMTALNTALGHLETLSNAKDALDNSSFGMWNTVANKVESASGDPRVKKFNVAADAVANELTKVFRGTGGSVHDVIEWRNSLSANDSPEQQKAAIQQATELLSSRLNSLGEQWKNGMNQNIDPTNLLSPKARKAYQSIMGESVPVQEGTSTVDPEEMKAKIRALRSKKK